MINKTHNENCIDTMKKMIDEKLFVDMVITSPPYDEARDYKGYDFDFETIALHLYRILKDGGVLVWVVNDTTKDGDESCTSFRQALYFKAIGFKLWDTMIYNKPSTPFPQKVRYNQSFEYMFVFSKGKVKTFNPILKKNISSGTVKKFQTVRNKKGELVKSNMTGEIKEYGMDSNVWYIPNGYMKSSKDKIAYKHPAIFPEELVERHIKSWSNEGDLIYDCFMGSGTVAKVCIQLNRNYIGSEMSNEYCEIIKERIKDMKQENGINLKPYLDIKKVIENIISTNKLDKDNYDLFVEYSKNDCLSPEMIEKVNQLISEYSVDDFWN
jgi:DNA modification methylase